jgi:MFS transporter, DHA3 family, macrolide efflux protein
MKLLFKLILSQIVSLTGSEILNFSLGILIFGINRNIFELSLIILVNYLPRAIFANLIGVFIDNINARYLILLCDISSLIATILLLFHYYYHNSLSIFYVVIFIIIKSAASGIQSPSSIDLAATYVNKSIFDKVSGYLSLIIGIPRFLGPILGAYLLSVSSINIIIIINVFAVVLSIFILLNIKDNINKNKLNGFINIHDSFIKYSNEYKDGWKYFSKNKNYIIIFVFLSVVHSSVLITLTVISANILIKGNAQQLGLVNSMGGLSTIIISLYIAIYGLRSNRIKVIVISSYIISLGIFIYSIDSIWAWILAAITVGMSLTYLNTAIQLYILETAIVEYRGRILSILFLYINILTPITILSFGYFLQKFKYTLLYDLDIYMVSLLSVSIILLLFTSFIKKTPIVTKLIHNKVY